MVLYVIVFSLFLGVSCGAIMSRKSRRKRELEISEIELLWKEKIPQAIKEHSGENELEFRSKNNSEFRISRSKGTAFEGQGFASVNKNGLPPAKQNKDQLKLFPSSVEAEDTNASVDSLAEVLEPPQHCAIQRKPRSVLIQLYIKRSSGALIDGPTLVRSLNKVGLNFGEMNVFHFANQKQADLPPIFSAANMHEPGTFDMNRVEILKTQGVVFFMHAFDKSQGENDFYLMLSAGIRMAELIKADLYGSPEEQGIDVFEKETLALLENINSG